MDALLIIDLQHAYLKDKTQYQIDPVIQRINQVAAKMRLRGDRIIFIQHDGDGITTAAPHTEGWKIYSELMVKPEDVIVRKTLNDAFANTELDALLKSMNIQQLVISGWATDFCVDASVQSAINNGYDCVVLSDCHTLADRPHLSAPQVIEHHNWLWANAITINSSIQVMSAAEYLPAYAQP